MRVYELAKKLGMESRLLIPELVRLGIEVTSHSNTLDDETARRITEALQGKDAHAGSLKSLKVKGGDSDKVVAQAKKGELRGSSSRQSAKGGRASSAVITEEPKKSEKKHILIKRKKLVEDELNPEAPMSEMEVPLGGEIQELSPLQEATTAPSEMSPPSPPSPIPPPPPDLSLSPTLSERKEGEGDIATVSPEPLPVPEIPGVAEVAQVGLAPKPEEERRGGKTEKKEAVPSESTDSIGEKVKKSKKGIRARDEDLFAARYEDAARWQDLRPLPTLRREERARHTQPTSVTEITKPRKKVIKLDLGISVKEFAEKLGQRPAEVIRKLMDVGIVLTLNQPMNLDAGMLIAEGMGLNVEVSTEKEGEALLEEVLEIKGEEQLIARAPVVTIMGHVDHGKTTLLDAIRETRVTDQEAGGITQHIGAYSVKVGDKRVTFLDTPGHEAFTAMRARGAQVTDIVVLVVSADDGVMPQTVEAIHHAQAANVPIIVAINKIDKPGANPDRVKQGLSEHNLISEAWGGQTIFVEVSAKEKQGLDHLLEMILLQAEVMELKGDIEGPARGVVLEAKLERGRGPVATVLVQAGHLKVGAVFVVGSVSGRIRALNSDTGAKLKEAGPSLPVEVIGLLGVPIAGDQFVVVKDDRMAREVADARHQKQRTADLTAAGARRTLDELYAEAKEREKKELSILIKADVQGSVGALCDSVEKITSSAVNLRVIHSGVGGISESDVLLAAASEALIIGFHVRPEPKASALAEREGVEIRLHTIIYNAIADVRAAAEGLLAPTLKERVLGRAEVRELFSVPKVGTIAGCYVNDGSIVRSSAGVRILRDHVMVYEGKVGSLRRFKDDVKEVQQGYECGIGVENYNDIKIGDVIEAFVYDEEAAKL
jgi:translation initiation factor IF-2